MTGSENVDSGAQRKLVAWVHVSMDGFTAGPDGAMDWLVEHAIEMMESFEGVWRGASTVLLGRRNYQGFSQFWPTVAKNPESPARDRDLAVWLDDVEKVVFSRTLSSASWRNARIAAGDLEAEVAALKSTPGRDILVLNSASIIQALLRADLVDELRVNLLPSVLGGGLRLFSEDIPASTWQLAGTTVFATGAVGLRYSRR
ncbi:dihydrofolate reductase [Nocardiopsis gilva YIM 90087]|uniref:Dihydrofolate reductase n=1 Tax=Nocardiopsis gilva YIM 90087 TaxID=1235441 RepID=A0A223S881_9ACTN|nr:dihydrofolate reductase family protein [Nocardiopsis gilva]ASU84299.1 dihydrofolate reductase [Nocardiopsis gilva YIM 90087]